MLGTWPFEVGLHQDSGVVLLAHQGIFFPAPARLLESIRSTASAYRICHATLATRPRSSPLAAGDAAATQPPPRHVFLVVQGLVQSARTCCLERPPREKREPAAVARREEDSLGSLRRQQESLSQNTSRFTCSIVCLQ